MYRPTTLFGDQDTDYLKPLFLFSNVLVSLAGIELVTLGFYQTYNGLIIRYSSILPLLLASLGALLFLFSFYGHAAATVHSQNHFKYLIYFGAAIYSRVNLNDTIEAYWKDAYNNYPNQIRYIEEDFQCCGLYTTDDRDFPKYSLIPSGNFTCVESPHFGYNLPCYKPLKRALVDESEDFIAWFVPALIVQLLTLGIAYPVYKRFLTQSEETTPLLGGSDDQ